MPKSALSDVKKQTKLATELELHSAVRNDRLVSLRGFHSDSAFCYLLLDIVGDGTTLADAIHRRGALPEREVAAHMAALLAALAYLHSCGIAHRDCKPANCLLRGTEAATPLPPGQESSLVLCDLGLAARCGGPGSDGPKRTGLCGTPNFVAPEVLARTGHDTQVDAWSAGAVAFTMLAGAPPFRGRDVEETYTRVRSGVYTPPPHMSTNARSFVACALCMCPEERATVAQLLQHAFLVEQTAPRTSAAEYRSRLTEDGRDTDTEIDALCGRLQNITADGTPAAAEECWSVDAGTPDNDEEGAMRTGRRFRLSETPSLAGSE